MHNACKFTADSSRQQVDKVQKNQFSDAHLVLYA